MHSLLLFVRDAPARASQVSFIITHATGLAQRVVLLHPSPSIVLFATAN